MAHTETFFIKASEKNSSDYKIGILETTLSTLQLSVESLYEKFGEIQRKIEDIQKHLQEKQNEIKISESGLEVFIAKESDSTLDQFFEISQFEGQSLLMLSYENETPITLKFKNVFGEEISEINKANAFYIVFEYQANSMEIGDYSIEVSVYNDSTTQKIPVSVRIF